MPDILLLLAALAAAQVPQAEESTLDPSTPGETAAAVLDCWRAIGPVSVDRTVLSAAGWNAVPVPKGGGPLTGFTKSGTNAMVLLADAEVAENLCTVVSRVSAAGQEVTVLRQVRQALLGVAPGIKTLRDGESIVLESEPRAAIVDRWTFGKGANQKPGTRIIVAYKIAEKK